jgi:ABC-type iron transport system FetAB permease component
MKSCVSRWSFGSDAVLVGLDLVVVRLLVVRFATGFFFVVVFFVAMPQVYTACGCFEHSLQYAAHMTKKKTNKRTSAPKKRLHERIFESDSTYFLKLVVVVILGTLWLKFEQPSEMGGMLLNAIPLGLMIGLLAVRAFEHHQADRKIWYAVLLIVGVISYFVPAGIVV